MTRSKVVPAVVLLMGLVAVVAIIGLQNRASTSSKAQLKLANVATQLTALQSEPFQSSASTGGSPALAARVMRASKQEVAQTLAFLQQHSPVGGLAAITPPLRANYAALDAIYAIGASGAGFGASADRLSGVALHQMAGIRAALDAAGRQYAARATSADRQATIGSAAAILALVAAFGLLYRRSSRAQAIAERLSVENARLAAQRGAEARTDSLTGLRNRRALTDDLASELQRSRGDDQLVLALFDLDGFKQYNDTFGHPAGDALLARLSEQLETALNDGSAVAYRIGGDEFCILTASSSKESSVVRLAAEALSETGDAFHIGCSYGIAFVPSEARTADEALNLADQRMYEHKAGRSSASRQSGDVLLKVLSERSQSLHEHVSDVAELARSTAEHLGLPVHEVSRIGFAAELHDIGKTAIPEAILKKPGPLDADEWTFMRRHPLIGERILLAAPSLAPAAQLVRSSHERFDGTGYPDSLSGTETPLGSSIIAVCDAFHAMVSPRAYRTAVSPKAAFAELRRCSGTQFHPAVVQAFCAVAENQLTGEPVIAAAHADG